MALMLTMTIDGVNVDRRVIYDVGVKVGRDDIETQPDASVITFTMLDYGPEQVGSTVHLRDSIGPVFTGNITDLTAKQDPGMKWMTEVTATGPLAILGQLNTGAQGFAEETDSQRIYAILNAVGLPHKVNPNILGPALLSHPPGEDLNAADAARSAADDGMGVLWEKINDYPVTIQYLPASQRTWENYSYAWSELAETWTGYEGLTWNDLNSSGLESSGSTYPGEFEIDPGTANAEVTFEQSIGDLARTIFVTYGPEPVDGGERLKVMAGSDFPQAEYDTQLVNSTDASNYATTMLRRRQSPHWRLTHILLYSDHLSPSEWYDLRYNLTVGLRLTVKFPYGSPVGHEWNGYLEGWSHAALPESHTLELNVSDRQLTEPADSWSEISANIRWMDIDPDLQWLYAVDLP